MDAEIQFFMSKKDEADFLAFVQKQTDNLIQNESGVKLVIGDCTLQFTSPVLESNALYAGKLEIRLGNPDIKYQELERAKSVFRKLRNWIKKHYWSRLAYINKNKNDKLMPTRVHWLAPDAKRWKEEDSKNHKLKLSKTSWMEFEIGF